MGENGGKTSKNESSMALIYDLMLKYEVDEGTY